MYKKCALALMALMMSFSSVAATGVGVMVGDPYWGVELKHNDLRFNVSLDDQFGLGANKVFGVNNTPFYLFLGGHYVDRNNKSLAIVPGIGAELGARPFGFYIDLSPSVYLDELDIELEARAGFRVYF
ncbi:hypothetical protein [Vibrio sp. WXL103]|uniref:hypothetical protein n=1 Tax=unclassified Vibrio TaxID=2614977 RepID=UPI003EC6B083